MMPALRDLEILSGPFGNSGSDQINRIGKLKPVPAPIKIQYRRNRRNKRFGSDAPIGCLRTMISAKGGRRQSEWPIRSSFPIPVCRAKAPHRRLRRV